MMTFLAVGLLISTTTKSQVIAYVASLFVLLFLWLLVWASQGEAWWQRRDTRKALAIGLAWSVAIGAAGLVGFSAYRPREAGGRWLVEVGAVLLLFALLAAYQFRVALLQAQLRAGAVVRVGIAQAVMSIVVPLGLLKTIGGGYTAILCGSAISYGLALWFSRAGEGPGYPVHSLDLGHDEPAEVIDVLRLGAHDDVVRPGHVFRLSHSGDLGNRGGHLRGLADLGLDEDVCVDHDVLPGRAEHERHQESSRYSTRAARSLNPFIRPSPRWVR